MLYRRATIALRRLLFLIPELTVFIVVVNAIVIDMVFRKIRWMAQRIAKEKPNRNKELDDRIKGISTKTLKNGGIESLYVKGY